MKLIIPKKGEPQSQADPFIIRFKDKFYIYATNEKGVTVYSSSDLFSGWKFEGFALSVEGQKEFWAPAVIELDGKLYMYYSSMPAEEDDVHKQAIKVAVATDPLHFEYKSELLPPFSIDAHTVKTDDGLYLFYSANDYEAERAGTYIAVRKMSDPFTVSGEERIVVRPTLDEEIFCRDRFKAGQHWHTLEGACYFKIGDVHYLMYSGNCYENPTYYLGYAVACGDKPLDELNFEKYPDSNTYLPLIKRDETEEGTGHNSVIEFNGEYYVVYHGRDIGGELKGDSRTARIAKLTAEGGKLTADKNFRK